MEQKRNKLKRLSYQIDSAPTANANRTLTVSSTYSAAPDGILRFNSDRAFVTLGRIADAAPARTCSEFSPESGIAVIGQREPSTPP